MSIIKSKRHLFVALLSGMLGWSACAHAEKVSVGYWAGSLITLPLYVAQEKGMFKANGLDVDMVKIPTGPAMTAALVSDSIQFADNAFDNLSTAVDKGLPVKAVIGDTVALSYALIVRSDYPLPHKAEGYPKVMEDLKGAKIGVVALGVSAHFITEKLFSNAGLKNDDVTYLAVGLPANARAALQNKSIDAYLSLWPLPTIAEATGEAVTIVNLIAGDGPPVFKDLGYSLWWSSDKTIKERPDLVESFVKANEQAYCWYNDPKNFDTLVSIAKKYAPSKELNDEQYRTMVRDQLPSFGVAITKRSAKTWQDLLVERKVINKAISYEDLVAPTAPENEPSCH